MVIISMAEHLIAREMREWRDSAARHDPLTDYRWAIHYSWKQKQEQEKRTTPTKFKKRTAKWNLKIQKARNEITKKKQERIVEWIHRAAKELTFKLCTKICKDWEVGELWSKRMFCSLRFLPPLFPSSTPPKIPAIFFSSKWCLCTY